MREVGGTEWRDKVAVMVAAVVATCGGDGRDCGLFRFSGWVYISNI